MTSNSHSFDDGASLVAVAGTNSTDADLWNVPDRYSTTHQSSLAFQPDALRMFLKTPNSVGVEMIAPAREPSECPAKEDWARRQTLITQLYLYEKRPLKEVMRHMENHHNFRATTKMYKTHIQLWRLDKKIKDVEMRAVVRKNKQRADQGKSSIIHVRGQCRDMKEFIRHCERKGVSIDDIIARHTSSPTPSTVELLTPAPSRMSTPQVLEVPERMFRCVLDYFSASFESGTWVRTEPQLMCYSIKRKEAVGKLAQDFAVQCDSAFTLFSKNLFEEGGRTLKAAFAKMERILLTDQPDTLSELISYILNLRRTNRDAIVLMILRHFSDLSKELLGREHPLQRIFDCYELLHTSDFDDIITRCVEGMIDHLESFVGAMHISTLLIRIRSIEYVEEGEARIQKLQRLLGECEGNLQPCDDRFFLVRHFLASEYYEQRHFVEAKNMSQKSLADSQYIRSEICRKNTDDNACYMIAKCQYALGEVDLGIANLNEAINSRISSWGPQSPMARLWLVKLEDWHLEQGNWDYAMQIRDYRMRTLPPIED